MAFVLVSSLSRDDIYDYIDKISNLVLFMLIGSLLGLILHYVGFKYIYKFTNPNGDESLFYFLTLSNATSGHFIRPSGFFAEPGYFGFIVSVVIFLRQLFGKNPNFSLILIVLTFVTQSMVFFLFSFFWFLDYVRNHSKGIKANLNKFGLILFSFVAILVLINLDFFDWVQNRIIGFVDDELFNARGLAWYDLLEQIKSQTWLGIIFGFDSDCIFRTKDCFTFGGVPLVPLLYGGLMYSWPYYLSIGYLIFLSFRLNKVRFTSIGLLFIAFSQPVFLELPYSLIYLFLFHSVYLEKRFNFL